MTRYNDERLATLFGIDVETGSNISITRYYIGNWNSLRELRRGLTWWTRESDSMRRAMDWVIEEGLVMMGCDDNRVCREKEYKQMIDEYREYTRKWCMQQCGWSVGYRPEGVITCSKDWLLEYCLQCVALWLWRCTVDNKHIWEEDRYEVGMLVDTLLWEGRGW